MPSVKEAAAAKKGEGKPLLRGEHVPKRMYSGFSLKVKDVREAPENWTGLFIVDFEPVKGLPMAEDKEPYTSWAVNKSNATLLAAQHGDDTDDWKGKKIDLVVVFTRNPTTKKTVPSLAVMEA